MMNRLPLRTLAPAILLCVSGVSPAQEHGSSHGTAYTPHHTLGVFIGDTTEERRQGGTLGLEYEYRYAERFGIGFIAEHVFGDFDTNVLVAPIAYHHNAWKLYVGPGVERHEGESDALLRLGVEYGFHFGELEVSPQVDLDFVNGEELFIFGVVFALPFD